MWKRPLGIVVSLFVSVRDITLGSGEARFNLNKVRVIIFLEVNPDQNYIGHDTQNNIQ